MKLRDVLWTGEIAHRVKCFPCRREGSNVFLSEYFWEVVLCKDPIDFFFQTLTSAACWCLTFHQGDIICSAQCPVPAAEL